VFVRYNGVQLEVERVVGWSDKNVYTEDNSERMFRHISMMVQCVIHPQATTLAEQAPTSAPAIVADLKRRLLEPRRFLQVKVGEDEVLSSPAVTQRADLPGSAAFDGSRIHFCDARGGPHPLYADVVSIHGTKTMLATFAIETWLVDSSALEFVPREGQPNRAEFSALISHRWEQSSSIDENYYTTRTTNGRAVFRADYLYEFDNVTGGLRQTTRKPSDYLSDLNHPLPLNYRRMSARGSLSSDGLTLTYTIVDQEQSSTTEADKPVASIKGTWSGGVSQQADAMLAVPGFPRYFTSLTVQATGRRGAATADLAHACLRAATTFDDGAQINRRMYFENRITASFGSGPRTVTLNIGYSIGGAIPFIVDGIFLGFKNPVVREIDLIEKKWPERLLDGLGDPVANPTVGQAPLLGMLGAGQPRMNSQQILDGQYVPPQSPIATAADLSQTNEADDARVARGENQRNTE